MFWLNTKQDLIKFEENLLNSYKAVALDVETYTPEEIKKQVIGLYEKITLSPYLSRVRLIQIGLVDSIEEYPPSNLNKLDQMMWVPKQSNFRCYVIDTHLVDKQYVKDVLNLLNKYEKIIVGHRLKFDIGQLWYHYEWEPKQLFCTLVASQLLGHAVGSTSIGQMRRSLRDICSDWLSRADNEVDIDKSEQTSDWSGTLTESQINYAITDTQYLIQLYILVKLACINLGMENDLNLEQEIVIPVMKMEMNGLVVDDSLYKRIIKLAEKELVQSKIEVANILGLPLQKSTGFGFRGSNQYMLDEKLLQSPKRLKAVLLESGINIDNLQADTLKLILETFSVEDNTSKENNEENNDLIDEELDLLEKVEGFKLSNSDKRTLVSKILRIKALNKLIGNRYERFINPVTGKIHPNFNQGRAQTGRFACTEPNLQALAKDGIYDTEQNRYYSLREIMCSPGKWVKDGEVEYWQGYIMCARDIDRQELVVAAYLSGDETLKEAIEKGEDLHTTHALMAWPYLTPDEVKKPSEKLGGKKPRDKAKTIIYGLLYGQDPLIMASNMGLSEQEGKAFYERLRIRYSKLFDWLDRVAEFGVKHKWVRFSNNEIVKRRRFLGSNAKGMGDDKTIARLSKNSPIQGISASQAKYMLRDLSKYISQNNLEKTLQICGQIHDEFILQTPGRFYLACSITKYQSSKTKRLDEYIQYIPEFEEPNILKKVQEIMSIAGGYCIENKMTVNTGAALAPYWAKD